jgi:hypothetical protein
MPEDFDDKIIAFHKFLIVQKKIATVISNRQHGSNSFVPSYANTTIKGKGEKSVIISTT